jgi:hypothetical protein
MILTQLSLFFATMHFSLNASLTIFQTSSHRFEVVSPTLPHYLNWQLSSNSDFHSILLEKLVRCSSSIELIDFEEAHLSPLQTYFIRARTESTNWSSPYVFELTRPILDKRPIQVIESIFTSNYLNFSSFYPYQPQVSQEVWEQLKPYFLPIHHPLKPKLDQIFHSSRVTLSKKTFQKAGFGTPKSRKSTNIYVGRHLKLPGVILKVYLDEQVPFPEWPNWMERILGAESIRKWIDHHGYGAYFKVPRKWIYPLPIKPSPPFSPSYFRRHFILVVEDMRILNPCENLKAYRKQMTRERLFAFYQILTELGLIDSVYPDNVPFTRDGRMAFIDTEHHHKGPIQYSKLTRFLDPSLQAYWQQLVGQIK